MEDHSNGVLLDTHVFIWLMTGSEPLAGSDALLLIHRASESSVLYISAVSLWEIGILAANGTLRASIPISEWVDQALATPGLRVLPLSAAVALDAASLPGTFQGDQGDRIIAATARVSGAILLTADARLLRYSRDGHLHASSVQPERERNT